MGFITFIFIALAAIPQGLHWLAKTMAGAYGCNLDRGGQCLISGNDQSYLLHLLYDPNVFSTYGLGIGGVGAAVCIVIIKINDYKDRRVARGVLDKAEDAASRGLIPGQTPEYRRPRY